MKLTPLLEKVKEFSLADKAEALKSRIFTRHVMDVLYLLRLNRPATALLMLWPMLWGFFSPAHTDWAALPLVILLAITMRSASCLFMDLYNPDIEGAADYKTAQAPLVAFLGLMTALSFLLAWAIGPMVMFLAIFWLIMVAAYPYLHKVTWYPQAFAGVIFGGWACLMGQGASGDLSVELVFLFPAASFWVAAVETLKADIKRAQDAEKGVKSVALVMGSWRIPFMSGCLILTLVMLVLTGIVTSAGGLFYASLMAAQMLLGTAYYGIHLNEHTAARTTYGRTAFAGLLVVFAFLLG